MPPDILSPMELSVEDIASIREEYKKQLVLPPADKIPLKQFFVGLVGLVGAGKTTVAGPLSSALSLVKLSNDDVRKLLKERGAGYEHLTDIMMPVAEKLSPKGFSIVFDSDCGNPKTKKTILELADEAKARVFWIHVNPPEDFIVKKLRTHGHTWLFKNGEQAVENYYEQKRRRQIEKTEFDFIASFDTSRLDLEEQVARAVSLITQALA